MTVVKKSLSSFHQEMNHTEYQERRNKFKNAETKNRLNKILLSLTTQLNSLCSREAFLNRRFDLLMGEANQPVEDNPVMQALFLDDADEIQGKIIQVRNLINQIQIQILNFQQRLARI